MERIIKNKIIAVTGGTEGIGFQIARYFLKAEAKLSILLDTNDETGDEAIKNLTKEFGPNKAVYIKCDIVKDLENAFQKIRDEYGLVDVLVNSADAVDEITAENCIDINFTAPIQWSLKFMELMREDNNGNGGTIINVTSILGYRVADFTPIYSATKFGINGFTKSMGHEKCYSKSKVRVIAICPGLTRTALMQQVLDGTTEFLLNIKNGHVWQWAEAVGEKAVEIFKIASSGTLWEVEDGKLREVK